MKPSGSFFIRLAPARYMHNPTHLEPHSSVKNFFNFFNFSLDIWCRCDIIIVGRNKTRLRYLVMKPLAGCLPSISAIEGTIKRMAVDNQTELNRYNWRRVNDIPSWQYLTSPINGNLTELG